MLVPVGATPEFEEARRRYGDLSTVVSSFAESYGGRVGEGGEGENLSRHSPALAGRRRDPKR
jgi:hypothetical protein